MTKKTQKIVTTVRKVWKIRLITTAYFTALLLAISPIPMVHAPVFEQKAEADTFDYKDYAKNNLSEFLGSFDRADAGNIAELAANIKAQFVGAGMSVEEATNKVYAIISVSDKANQAVSAIGNEGFVAIKDAATAADYKIKVLGESLLKTTNGEAIASGLDSMIALLDTSMNKLVGTKDEFDNVIDAGKALEMQFDKIAATGGVNPIGETAMNNLIKVRPELEAIIIVTGKQIGRAHV